MVRNGEKGPHRSNFQCGTHDGLLKTVSWIYIGPCSPLERTYNTVVRAFQSRHRFPFSLASHREDTDRGYTGRTSGIKCCTILIVFSTSCYSIISNLRPVM
jgi:hypothetical protein